MKQNSQNKPLNMVNGVAGENIVADFLVGKGLKIISRNYREKWGEIDIVALKGKIFHFVEVKTVSQETGYRPEDNVHPWKLKRLRRVIQTFLLDMGTRIDLIEWQFDIAVVFLSRKRGEQVSLIEDLVL